MSIFRYFKLTFIQFEVTILMVLMSLTLIDTFKALSCLDTANWRSLNYSLIRGFN